MPKRPGRKPKHPRKNASPASRRYQSASKGPKHPKDVSGKQSTKKPDPVRAIVLRVVQPRVERGDLEIFKTPNNKSYATMRVGTHFETYAIRSEDFRMWLAREIYAREREVPGDTKISKVILMLDAQARFDPGTVVREVFTRIAEFGGCIYLDLADADWRVIEITPHGWWLTENPPVRFTRSPESLPVPVPEDGGDLNEVFNLVHVTRRQDRVLFLAWLLGALQVHDPCPILAIYGCQGAAKTSACRIAAALIDPAIPQLGTVSGSERDLIVSALSGHVIAFDNVSEIGDRLSDSLCRIVTGSGFKRRKLRSDSTVHAVSVKRPIVLNAISRPSTRGDLLDRMIAIRLDPIPENERREEGKLLAEFKELHPKLLGALLTAASAALCNLGNVHIENLTRMADFEVRVTAAERELGFNDGEFHQALRKNRQESSDTILELSAIGLSVVELVKGGDGVWQGSMKDLLKALNARVDEQQRRDPEWPRSARGLKSALDRLDANLDQAGFTVQRPGKDPKTRRAIVCIEAKQKSSVVEFHAEQAEETAEAAVSGGARNV